MVYLALRKEKVLLEEKKPHTNNYKKYIMSS